MARWIDDREKRRSFRVAVHGTASVWRDKSFGGFYTVHDLSLGGCCLRDGPDCAFDEPVDVVLHVHELELMQVPAWIVRHRVGELALRFMAAPTAVEDRIHDVIVASLEARRGMPPRKVRRRSNEPPIVDRFDPQNDHHMHGRVSDLIA